MRESGKLSALTLISRVLGLIREMTRGAFMGTGVLGDAFTFAFLIPNFLRRLFAEGSISVAFIPTFKGCLLDGDRKKTDEFLSATFTVLVFILSLVTVAGILSAGLIVGIFESEAPDETAILTRIMFPYLGMVALAALFQGVLNSIGIFTPSGLAPILFNLCFIFIPALLSVFMPNPARAMAVAVVVGGLAQALCQLPPILKRGFRFKFMGIIRAFKNPGMRRVFILIAPTILGMAAYQLNDLVCTVVASRVGTGVATSLVFSLRLQELILGIFAVSLGTVLLPDLTEKVRNKDWAAFSERLGKSLEILALITIPISIFAMLEGRDIVTLLFKVREFSEESVRLTTEAFFFHMIGLFFIAINRVIAPAFYAQSDTRSPTYAGLAAFSLNIVLAIGLASFMKGGGIALALSISSVLNSVLLIAMLFQKRIDGMLSAVKLVLGYALKMLLFSVVAGVPLFLITPWIRSIMAGKGRILEAGVPLVVSSLVFAFLGVGLLALSKDRVLKSLLEILGRRKKRAISKKEAGSKQG